MISAIISLRSYSFTELRSADAKRCIDFFRANKREY